MKVLVTGASGMIGSALCDALLDRDDTVVGLTRDPENARHVHPTVLWHPWQPHLERPPAEAFEGVDAIVNLVGERIDQRWTDESKSRILESRRTATHNLVGTIAGLERKPQVMVSQAAIGYYGDRGDEAVDEASPPGEGFDSEVVREWEKAAHEVEGSGVRLVVVRTGHVLDARGGMLGRMLPPFKMGVGGPLAGGDQYVSWIHLADEVGILLWALDNDEVRGTINATAPEPVTNKEFSQAMGRALGRPAVIPVPGLTLDLMFGREFGKVLRGGQRVLPRRALELGYEFKYDDAEKALRSLL
ncbi:MAG TPA: TIGR01777 family oxidoreductase [Solirubrobacterales bacterium]|nr:TIGR01777 family oxidoreductase [Solirubrobacterales bacterium]